MSQGGEPSVVDYARFYGLIKNHLETHPLATFSNEIQRLPQSLDDTPDLFHIHADTIEPTDRRLSFDARTASLLSSVAAVSSAKEQTPLNDEDDGTPIHRVRRMKAELPMLRSDHEIDLLRFARRVVPNLKSEFLPLENLDEEADEGLTWPSRYHTLPSRYKSWSESEQLLVSRQALDVLQESLQLRIGSGCEGTFEVKDRPYMKKYQREPVSPPLLPLTPENLLYVPESETGHLNILSDHTSPTKDELSQAERALFIQDSIVTRKRERQDESSQCSDPMLFESDSLGDIYSPLKGIKDQPSLPPPLGAPFQDPKAEVPLVPADFDHPPPWKNKSVSFCEALTDLIPDLPSPVVKPDNASSSDVDKYFAHAIAPIVVKAEREIEQEQLHEEDTVVRVPVPAVDFSVPIAAWTATNHFAPKAAKNLTKHFLAEIKNAHFSRTFWTSTGNSERDLKWSPFPVALGGFETQEGIVDNGALEKWLARPEKIDMNSLAWKSEGLRILDELRAPEEELKEGTFSEEKDFESLIRKRKLNLDAAQVSKTLPGTALEVPASPSKQEYFQTIDALDAYLGLRKGRVKKLKSYHFSAAVGLPTSKPPDQPSSAPYTDKLSSVHKPTILPGPKITPPATAFHIVVSASFMGNRKLSRQIQQTFPAAEFIERDFNLYLETQAKSAAGPPMYSGIADEADFIVSPSTGLICTTLQKIEQRSLPGQAVRSAIKERLSKASQRYESLLILISEDRQVVATDFMDNSDCEALMDFMAFCSTLPGEVQPTFVGGGGQQELANWIVALMIKHGVPDIGLLQDETLWEIFLRRAGMNAFAAQAVLGRLKAPEHADVGYDFGLTAFIEMSAEARIERFEHLLGGIRVLRTVSRAIDHRW